MRWPALEGRTLARGAATVEDLRVRWMTLLFALAWTACDAPVDPDAGAADGARCLDDRTMERCVAGTCEQETCRDDALCVATDEAGCVPWEEAALSCDFTLSYAEDTPRRVHVAVLSGGFPRPQVEALRFDFGDGVAGWGEVLRHDYAAGGVYPVTLEVRLSGHRVLRASRLAVVDPPAEHRPLELTVDDIPTYLNGSVPFIRDSGTPDDPIDDVEEAFRLAVPPAGFTVDVTLLELPDDPIDRASLSLTADVAMGASAAGEELASRLVFSDGGTDRVARARWIVADDEAAPEGDVGFTLRAETRSGRAVERALTVRAVPFGPERQPFDRPMVWLFRPHLDFFRTERDGTGATSPLVSTPGADGAPDLAQELRLLGAQGDEPALDAAYLAWILEAIRAETYRYFGIAPDGTPTDGIPLTIVYEGEPGAPRPEDFRTDGDVSMMRFGGSFDGFLGFSGFAPYNEGRVDDSGPERGVATGSLLSILTSTPVVSDAILPLSPVTGVPVGAHEADATVLAPGFDPYAATDPRVLSRYHDLRRIARYLALAIASVTAHEMGHAMGLMPNGPPPDGFFGGEGDVSFIGRARTNSHHTDFPGLNLMQSGGDYLGVIDEALATIELPRGADLLGLAEILALENRLSPYARAYLQGRLTYEAFE